ncbi:hypothetical protein [Corallococcus silvisoli]|uniref:hypothetical protein n=1 Tax=Corallococcus silvisoli TaxID=2697031 RepID=UPI001376E013|nr:hypothetical protein [Corallococcus silvisoli]NBD08505.1 hypothetical protein [Corallococcus silvisoli]
MRESRPKDAVEPAEFENSVSDKDLHEALSETTARYPHLKAILPADWPHGARFGIDKAKMAGFARKKEGSRYWHALNLPLCVHAAGAGFPDSKARTLMESLLRVLDGFARDFGTESGVRKTLEPLWTDSAWNIDPPEIWSVVATAFLAQTYQSNGFKPVGFGLKIGEGQKDADIQFRKPDGTVVHVDVEAWHAVKFAELDPTQARAELQRRVEAKCGSKFKDLPSSERGVAAIVCMAAGTHFELMMKYSSLAGMCQLDGRYAGQFGYVYWVGGTTDGQSMWVELFDEPALKKRLAEASNDRA